MAERLVDKLVKCLEWYKEREIKVHGANPNVDYVLWAERLIAERKASVENFGG